MKIENLIDKIIESEFPNEKEYFLVWKNENPEYSNLGTNNKKRKKDGANFMEGLEIAKSILEFIPLIISTFKITKSLFAKKSLKQIQGEWKREMISEGINEKKATEIVNKYSSKLKSIISKENNGAL